MTFQEQRDADRRFRAWVSATRDLLLASGIPQAAWLSRRNWGYFVEHAELPYELDASCSSVRDLTPEQARVLREILEREYGNAASVPCLLAILRHDFESVPALAPPWHHVLGEAPKLEAELRREVGPGHVLWKRDLRAVARRSDADDVLFVDAAEPQSVTAVHLTWSGDREPDPRWPETMTFASWDDWRVFTLSSEIVPRRDDKE